MLKWGEKFEGGGNVFVSDDGGAAETAAWGGPWAEMRWLAPDHLQISYEAEARVFEQARERGDVRVSYRAVRVEK